MDNVHSKELVSWLNASPDRKLLSQGQQCENKPLSRKSTGIEVPKCMLCGRRHYLIMCLELPINKEVVENSDPIDSSNMLLVAKETNEVLLQTVFVNIESNGRKKLVRALLDSGSQKCHLLKRTVEELVSNPRQEEV
ncbi:hypothetical protein JTE90_010486 [Oedothorax gibbosus]|uniref:Peptidase aspartic putative domain-containing protein n=1 Tax=Oedothorax gibbosus TaxID=931172 RepID=A0AAV6VZU8_9ARAC|nr:hypothetical protein JTE90_010486 [Oedothorax gibbosus]